MKTEFEFISGVYEKYAKEQEIRRKRVRTLSLCATFSACACIAVFISLRTVPILLDGNAKTAEDAAYAYKYTATNITAERAVEYELYDVEAAVEEAAEEAVFDASLAAPTAEAQNGDNKVIMNNSDVKKKAHDGLCGAIKTDEPAYIAGINGEFTYVLPSNVRSDVIAIGVNSAVDCELISENVSVSGAVYGKCSEGYYVSFSEKDTLFILIKDTEAVSEDELKALADSVIYTLK